MNGAWKLTQVGKKPKLNNPVLIEGLPGIGNVGKVAVDFIIEELKAKKLFDVFSYTFPHSVFVNDKNLVELPIIEVYYKKMGKKDLLLLAGDVQPIDEVSSYEFSDTILDMAKGFGCKEVVTLGGIGLQTVPKKPKVYCTGNTKEIVGKYCKGVKMSDKLYGVVGPIVGVSGLLVGLAGKKKMEGVAMLAETFGHPMYLGMKGAKEILFILDKKLGLKLDLKKIDAEIKDMENELVKRTGELAKVSKQAALKKIQGRFGKEISYIG